MIGSYRILIIYSLDVPLVLLQLLLVLYLGLLLSVNLSCQIILLATQRLLLLMQNLIEQLLMLLSLA